MHYEIYTCTKVIATVPFDSNSQIAILNARRLACEIIELYKKSSGERFVNYRETK